MRWCDLLPGVLGDDESAEQDSFVDGLLDWPHYTRPEEFEGQAVPAVLVQRQSCRDPPLATKQALGRTWLRRPDLIEKCAADAEQRELLDEFMAEHAQRAVK